MKPSIFLIVILAMSAIIYLALAALAADPFLTDRAFLIEEKIILKSLLKDTIDLCIWIPYPVNDDWQIVDDFRLSSPFDASVIEDGEYGNKIIYLRPKQKIQSASESEITISFKVRRREYDESSGLTTAGTSLSRFLKADRRVPVNGEIKRLAEKIVQGKKDDLEKIRAIYDYIIDELTYSKDDPKVCGIGDSLLTLRYKKGICTDYHSLFISLVRSLGIPAKFEIGFRIPIDAKIGKLNGYHCWAKFYLKGKGWIPVDISEADKHPEKRDYFFGRIDENRIHLVTGRDIYLKYSKGPSPLNFFVYPYAELNGQEFMDIDTDVSFKDLEGGG